jgi:hypothetical protein
MGETLPELQIERIAGVDGREYQAKGGWKPAILQRLQAEGVLGQQCLLDPVRTALCLSHQRALTTILERAANQGDADAWTLIFEDDARPGEALAAYRDHSLPVVVPEDAEVLFLHDRAWKRGGSPHDTNEEATGWRVVRGGIGLEAYAVNRIGAHKMLEAFRPVIEECDIQLMTFMEGYADLEYRAELHQELRTEGKGHFPEIHAYAPTRPLFQTDHWVPSVKFATINEAG